MYLLLLHLFAQLKFNYYFFYFFFFFLVREPISVHLKATVQKGFTFVTL